WLAEEFAALKASFSDRGKRLDEYIEVMRALWSGDKTTFDGDFFQFENCISRPRPAQGSVPIIIGGHSKAAARRAGRLGDGFFPGNASATEIADLVTIVRQTAEENDRDPDSIQLIAGGGAPPGPKLDERIEKLTAIGVTHAIMPTFPPDKLADIGRSLNSTYG
ncbi:MAG: LLM class F420-dependent oxidoreductase, partial [Actinobacteria bacterium]